MDAIDAIKAQIKSKRLGLMNLKEKEQELKRLQAEVALLPDIKADLVALERSLAILQGEDAQAAHKNLNRIVSSKMFFPDTAAKMVVSILEEAAKPMTLEQIMPLLRVRGASIAETTVRGSLYRNIRKARYFKLIGPGLFALRKWPAEVNYE